jgi:ABC-type glycerol-3-phosphate transport system substrate-binding protein
MAALVVLALLAACAPTPAPTQEAQPPAPAETEAPVVVTEAPEVVTEAPAAPTEVPAEPAAGKYPEIVVACWSGPEHDNLVKVAAEYEKKTGNKVIVEEIAREAYYDKLTTTFIGGGSDYDAAYIMSDWPPAWVEAGALHGLNEYINNPDIADPNLDVAVFEPSISFFKFEGEYYAFPSEGDTAWLWTRKDLLEEKGLKVPETWDEYLEVAKALNAPPDVYGTVIGAKPDEALWDFMYYLFGFGGAILDENNKVVINNEAGVKALTFYSDLLIKEQVVPPDVVTYGYNEILTSLQEGKVAMGIQWMAATQTLTDCNQSPKVCKDGQPLLQYNMTPGIRAEDGSIQRKTGGSQWGWGIPAGAPNPEAAYKFIEWLTSKEGASLWALNGGIPSIQEALMDPAVVAEIPQFELLGQVMPFRYIVPPTTVTADMVTAINEAVVAAVTGTKTPQQALDDAAAKLKEMLEKAGYPQ